MSKLSVVHLVRRVNGLEPFQQFLMSYLKHAAGIDHDLVILFKGFNNIAYKRPYQELLTNLKYIELSVPDSGFDLVPYFIAAEKLDTDYLCFLNSFSVVNDDYWLLKLYQQITQQGVGIVGATGSWGSIMPDRTSRKENLPLWNKILRPIALRILPWYFSLNFEPFPNYHIRSNAFMIASRHMRKIRRGWVILKMDAYKLESGRNSITRQIERMGLRPLVVGKDGVGYEKQKWNKSKTFWWPDQSNLLVSDNQTRKYESESKTEKSKLELFAWGRVANAPSSETSI